jgi:hypothetical protein
MAGYIRVINKRDGKKAIRENETVVPVDRTNPVLGNPYVLRDKRSKEQRNIVCDQYERMGEYEMQHGGPIRDAIVALAARVESGENIALQCWCKPCRCHADWVADRIREKVEDESDPIEKAAAPRGRTSFLVSRVRVSAPRPIESI